MPAIWMQLGNELRRRWRAWLGLAVLIGLAGGIVVAAATGARRTDTAYVRFLDAQRSSDTSSGGIAGPEEMFLPNIEELKTLPQVAEWADAYAFPGEVFMASGRSIAFPQVIPVGDEHNVLGTKINKSKIVKGRPFDPSAEDEATVSFAAEGAEMTVGSRVRIALAEDAGFPPETEIAVRIVGVHAAPGEFQSINGVSFPTLRLAPGVIKKHLDLLKAAPPSSVLTVDFRLKRGRADVASFVAEAGHRGILVELPIDIGEHLAGVRKTMRFEATALWILAILVAAGAAAVFGQSISRTSLQEATEYPTLRALGMSRGALIAVGMARAAAIGAIAAFVAVAAGIAASPLTPIGAARIAEPQPGIHADALVLTLGALGVIAAVILTSILPSIRAAGVRGIAAGTEIERASRSALASALARAGGPPSAVAGVRMALEPGRGRAAVPVRSTILGIAAGAAALVMGLTFHQSLQALISLPELSGYTWDMMVAGNPDTRRLLDADEAIDAVGSGGATNVIIGGNRMLAFTWDESKPTPPVVLEGRAPRSPEEIVLGTKTLRDLRSRIGDRVEVVLASPQSDDSDRATKATYTITGRGIIPQLFFEPHEPGEGAAFTIGGYSRLERPEPDQVPALVRLKNRADVDDVAQRLRKSAFVVVRQQRADMASIDRISALPLVLSGILGGLAAAALAHALLSTARRRRRELAILKTLGFSTRQVTATVLWQATTLVLIAVAGAIPAGIIAGRWLWTVFANQVAVVPRPVLPALHIAAVVPAAMILAVLVAVLPARSAARTRAVTALRTE